MFSVPAGTCTVENMKAYFYDTYEIKPLSFPSPCKANYQSSIIMQAFAKFRCVQLVLAKRAQKGEGYSGIKVAGKWDEVKL